jgi:hypothetical protein
MIMADRTHQVHRRYRQTCLAVHLRAQSDSIDDPVCILCAAEEKETRIRARELDNINKIKMLLSRDDKEDL